MPPSNLRRKTSCRQDRSMRRRISIPGARRESRRQSGPLGTSSLRGRVKHTVQCRLSRVHPSFLWPLCSRRVSKRRWGPRVLRRLPGSTYMVSPSLETRLVPDLVNSLSIDRVPAYPNDTYSPPPTRRVAREGLRGAAAVGSPDAFFLRHFVAMGGGARTPRGEAHLLSHSAPPTSRPLNGPKESNTSYVSEYAASPSRDLAGTETLCSFAQHWKGTPWTALTDGKIPMTFAISRAPAPVPAFSCCPAKAPPSS